jgi:hypothetical protein
MSDTPETDAAIKDQSEWKLPFVSATMDGVTYDGPVASLCRRMERERDEARAGRQAYKQLAVKHAQERDRARALAEEFHRDQVRLLMERDKAREKIVPALQAFQKLKAQ